MSLFKKKTSRYWYAQVWVPRLGRRVVFSTRREDRAGAEEVERTYLAANRGDADGERLHEVLDAVLGRAHERKGVPLAQAFDRYAETLETTGRSPSAKTLAYKRRSVAALLGWIAENSPATEYASEVDREVAGRFARWYNARKDVGDKTKHETVAALGTVWNVLMGADPRIGENPWRFFLRAVRDATVGRAFSEEEERRVLSACAGTEWYLASLVARYTGLRLGDVARLRWEDVDWGRRAILLTPSKTRRHGIRVVLPLTGRLYAALERRRRPSGGILPELHAVYPHTPRLSYGPFSCVLKEVGLGGGYTFHSWRHTFRTRLSEAGVSDDIAKRLGGWTQDATAMRYDHAERLEEMRAAIERTDGPSAPR